MMHGNSNIKDFLFFTTAQNFLRAHTASCKMSTKTLSLEQSGRGLAFPEPPLVPRSRTCGAVLLLLLCVCM